MEQKRLGRTVENAVDEFPHHPADHLVLGAGRAVDVGAILERCTDDVDWAAEAAIEVAPWHGVKRGKAEVPSFFAGIAQTGPVTEFSPLSFTSNDDGGHRAGCGHDQLPEAILSAEKRTAGGWPLRGFAELAESSG